MGCTRGRRGVPDKTSTRIDGAIAREKEQRANEVLISVFGWHGSQKNVWHGLECGFRSLSDCDRARIGQNIETAFLEKAFSGLEDGGFRVRHVHPLFTSYFFCFEGRPAARTFLDTMFKNIYGGVGEHGAECNGWRK